MSRQQDELFHCGCIRDKLDAVQVTNVFLGRHCHLAAILVTPPRQWIQANKTKSTTPHLPVSCVSRLSFTVLFPKDPERIIPAGEAPSKRESIKRDLFYRRQIRFLQIDNRRKIPWFPTICGDVCKIWISRLKDNEACHSLQFAFVSNSFIDHSWS